MQEKPNISLSIAIVCYHSSVAELRALVASILQSLQQLKVKVEVAALPIYLIDNSESSTWESSEKEPLSEAVLGGHVQLARELDVELHLVSGQGNVGYGSAHNLVLPELESDFHLLLNPDMVLQKQCLPEGITYLLDNPDVVFASPSAEFENGEKQFLCKRYPSVFTLFARGFFPRSIKKSFAARLRSYEMQDLSENKPTKDIPIASGCFMLCRSKAFKAVGGFDGNYFLYFEDFDFSQRIKQQGSIAYLPNMKIQHAGGNTARKGLKHLRMFVKSGIRFFNTYGWHFFANE